MSQEPLIVEYGTKVKWTEEDVGRKVILRKPWGTEIPTEIVRLRYAIPYVRRIDEDTVERGEWGCGEYVIGPLEELGQAFAQAEHAFPKVQVMLDLQEKMEEEFE